MNLKKSTLVPLFAMGINYQVQTTTPAYFEASPSNDEIEASTLQQTQNVNPIESLKNLPGMTLTGTDVTTYTASLFLRGSDADHTLFIWNDLRSDNFTGPNGATDPFSFGGEFSNRIKILKGPQSLLYGSQALGGVVLIGEDPDLASSVEVMGGSLNSARSQGEARFQGKGWRLAVGGSAFSTEGISSVKGTETDGRQKSSLTAIFANEFANYDELQILVNTSHEKSSYDLPPNDDVNAHAQNGLSQWKARYKTKWSSVAESVFLATGQAIDRDNRNPADAASADFYIDQSRGERQTFSNRNNFILGASLWHVGFESIQEQSQFQNTSSASPASQFGPSLREESLYLVNDQLYSIYGDPALKAESSQAIEAGLVQRWQTLHKLRVAVYQNRFQDLIDYDFTVNKSRNVKRAKTQGLEFAHEWDSAFGDSMLSIAYVDAKNEGTGAILLRRPTYQASLSGGYQQSEFLRFGGEVLHIGVREDIDSTGSRVKLSNVTVMNALVSYKFRAIHYFLRVNNVADIQYEDIAGYQTTGRFYWTGARVDF